MLIGIFLDSLLTNFSKYTKIGKAFGAIIFLLISVILVNYSATIIYGMCAKNFIKNRLNKTYLFETNLIEGKLEYAKDIKNILGKVDFVLTNEVYYYLATEQKDMKKFPAYEDLFTYENCEKIIDFMQDEDTSICIESGTLNFLKYHYNEELEKIIKEKYQEINLRKYEWVILVNKENFENIGRLNEI